jgi:hypothetical protein
VCAAVLVALIVSGVGWLALGSAGPRDAGAAVTVPPSVSSGPPVSGAPSAGSATPDEDVDPSRAAPVTLEEWRTLVHELYLRRAEALSTASPALLDDVYADGSPLRAADARFVSSLASAGEVLRGFVPDVGRVTAARPDGARVHLDLVDSWASYEVVAAGHPDGPGLRTGAGQAAAGVRMVLVRTGEGWRIESAERTA